MSNSDLEKARHYLKECKPHCDTFATKRLHEALEHLAAAVEHLANPLAAVEPCPEPDLRERMAKVAEELLGVYRCKRRQGSCEERAQARAFFEARRRICKELEK